MERIDLGALLEAPEEGKGKEKGKGKKRGGDRAEQALASLSFDGTPSRGTTTKDVKAANSRAASEPEALLDDLGVGKVRGGSAEERVAAAVDAARSGNAVFAQAFGPPLVATDGGATVVMIRPRIDKGRHPNVYIGAIAAALQAVGALPNDFEPESRVSRQRLGRNIVQSNDPEGLIVVAPKAWLDDQQRRAVRDRKARRAAEREG